MALFRLNRVSLAFGDLPIFTEVDFAIEPGERVCLIGRNGAGKTTLLRLVTGELAPDSGEVALQRDLVVSTLEQDLSLDDNRTVREVVASGLAPLQALVERFEALAHAAGSRHAAEAEALQEAMARALQIPYTVKDTNGETVASGVLDGEAVELPAGRYLVELQTQPPRRFRDVSLAPGESRELDIGAQ